MVEYSQWKSIFVHTLCTDRHTIFPVFWCLTQWSKLQNVFTVITAESKLWKLDGGRYCLESFELENSNISSLK